MSPTASKLAYVNEYEQPTWITEDASNLLTKMRYHRGVDSKQTANLETSKAGKVNVKPLPKGADAEIQNKEGDVLQPSTVNTVSEPKANAENNDDDTTADPIDNNIASTGSPGSPGSAFLEYLRKAATKRPKRTADSKSLDLFEAAKMGDLESVKYWVEEKGVDVNIQDTYSPWKDTPLLLAAQNGQLAIAKYLVDKNADVNAKSFFSDETPLHVAVANGHLNMVKYLVGEKGVSVNANIKYGNSLLHLAAENGQLEVAKYLVEEQNANVNARNVKGATPLFRATEHDRLDFVKYLVKKGANVNDKLTAEEFSPVHIACDNGNLDLVKYFIEDKGIDVNIRSKREYTPLIRATFCEQTDIVKYLVGDRKADVNLKDLAGQTALHYASEKEVSIDLVKYLVVNGKADVNVKDLSRGDYPIHGAARHGNLDVVKFFAEEKAVDINAKNNDGESLMHLAAQGVGNYQSVIRYLVDEWKADVNVLTPKGDTPLHTAVQHDHPAAVKLLIDMKANVNLKNNEGFTPLALARKRSISNSIIRYLESAEMTRSKRTVSGKPLLDFVTEPKSLESAFKTRPKRDDVHTSKLEGGPHYRANAAGKPTSFIHSVVHWLTSSFSSFLLPSPNKVENSIPYPKVSSSLVDGLLILFDVGVRKFYGNNYKQPMHESLLSPDELLQLRIDPVALSVVNDGTKRVGKLTGNHRLQDTCPAHPFGYANGVIPKYVCVGRVDALERAMLPCLSSSV